MLCSVVVSILPEFKLDPQISLHNHAMIHLLDLSLLILLALLSSIQDEKSVGMLPLLSLILNDLSRGGVFS